MQGNDDEQLTNNAEPAPAEGVDAGDECHCDSGSEEDGPQYVYVCKMHRGVNE